MLQIIKISLVMGLLFVFSGCTKIEHPAPVMSVEEVAMDGYDVVAYFKSQKAIKGDANIKYSYKGVNWYFSSADNRNEFEANPQNYFPAFGGFCAYELADERVVNSDPQFWHIHNDTLFLFSDEDERDEWYREISIKLPSAQAYWTLINEPTEEEK